MNSKSIDFISKATRQKNWEIAKKAALQLDPGRIKRIKSAIGSLPSTYQAGKLSNGIAIVIGDTMDDIPKPTMTIHGRPAMSVTLSTQIKL